MRDRVAQFGGVATRWQLLSTGLERDLIEMATDYGVVRRIRRGYYATREVSPMVIDAVAVGGVLGCVSALRFRDLPFDDDGRLHVAVPRSRSGLRLPPDRQVVVHWMRYPSRGDSQSVTVGEAMRQAARCRALQPSWRPD